MNDKKEFIKRTFICVLFVLLCYSAVHFIIGTRKDIHDNGHGANAVRNEFRSIEKAQREETSVIDGTAESITRSQKGIDESTRTNKSIEKLERKDAEIIDECQQILASVRGRTATEN